MVGNVMTIVGHVRVGHVIVGHVRVGHVRVGHVRVGRVMHLISLIIQPTIPKKHKILEEEEEEGWIQDLN
jgi:hypothetical protein